MREREADAEESDVHMRQGPESCGHRPRVTWSPRSWRRPQDPPGASGVGEPAPQHLDVRPPGQGEGRRPLLKHSRGHVSQRPRAQGWGWAGEGPGGGEGHPSPALGTRPKALTRLQAPSSQPCSVPSPGMGAAPVLSHSEQPGLKVEPPLELALAPLQMPRLNRPPCTAVGKTRDPRRKAGGQ